MKREWELTDEYGDGWRWSVGLLLAKPIEKEHKE